MKRSIIYERRGFITVPTAIFLAVICLFDLVLTDAASVISAKHFYERRASMSLESILAGYDSVLFAKYGLLGLNISHYTSAETDFIKYISEPFRSDVIAFSRLDRKGHELSFLASLSEPDALDSAIVEQMKYKSVANVAVYISQALGLLDSAGKLSGAAADVAQGEKVLTDAKTKLDDLKHKVEGYFTGDTMCVNGYADRKRLFLLSGGKVLLKTIDLDLLDDSAVIIREALEEFHANISLFATLNTDAFDLIAELKNDAAEIERCASKAESHLSEITDEDSRTELRKKIARLRAEAIVLSNDGLVEPLRKNIEEINKRASGISENILMIDAVYTVSGERIEEVIEQIDMRKFIENIAQALDDTGIRSDLKVATFYYSSDEGLLEYDSRKKEIKDISIYTSDSYVVPDSVYSMLPSVKAGADGIGFNIFDSFDNLDDVSDSLSGLSRSVNTDNAFENALSKFLICDYVSSYFSDVCARAESSVENDFVCEKEYILGGHKESSENVKKASNLLLGIRFAFNFMHCFGDDTKHSFATEIGNAIAGALTGGVGGELFAILIICAWSMAESYVDVHALRNGEKVPVIKNSDNWKTSIDGLLSSGASGGSDDDDSIDFSLDYSQYLMLLILLMPRETVLYRIADVIEINMTEYVGERYMLSGVFTSVSCSIVYVPKLISPLFIAFGKERLKIEIEETVSY